MTLEMFVKQYVPNGYIRLFGYVDDGWELLSDGYIDADAELDYFEENTVTKDAILYGGRMKEYCNCDVIRLHQIQLEPHPEAINICIDVRQALQQL